MALVMRRLEVLPWSHAGMSCTVLLADSCWLRRQGFGLATGGTGQVG